MGQLSAKAQGLSGVITTGSKLQFSDHRLYMLKDTTPDSRQVIGILKVGLKNLFIYDMHGVQHEMEPLCVLDFYVHESRQRQGCGRKLFDFMLTREDVIPRHLAIDRPSHKFTAFLGKHYQLQHMIPQMYKFVVFQGFFRDRQDGRKGRRHSVGRPDSAHQTNRHQPSPPQYLQQQLQQLQQKQLMQQASERPASQRKVTSASCRRENSARPPPGPSASATSAIPAAIPANAEEPSTVPASTLGHQVVCLNSSPTKLLPNRKGIILPEESHPKEVMDNRTIGAEGSTQHVVLNAHNDYLTRNGRMRVGDNQSRHRETQSAPYGNNSPNSPVHETGSWVASLANSSYTYEQGLNRNQRHTRLW